MTLLGSPEYSGQFVDTLDYIDGGVCEYPKCMNTPEYINDYRDSIDDEINYQYRCGKHLEHGGIDRYEEVI